MQITQLETHNFLQNFTHIMHKHILIHVYHNKHINKHNTQNKVHIKLYEILELTINIKTDVSKQISMSGHML